MPKKLVLSMLVLGLLLVPVLAQAKVVTITNNTGSYLMELYVSAMSTNNWEEDVLGGSVLGPGESWRVDFAPGYGSVDLLAIFDNGVEHAYTRINIPSVSSISLNPSGATSR